MKRPLSSYTKKAQEDIKVRAVVDLVDAYMRDATYEHHRADRNYVMFIHGSQFQNKKDWQANFTIPKWERSIRAAHANVKNRVLNHHDFFDLDPYNKDNVALADILRSIKKAIYWHMGISKFRKKMSAAILDALIFQGHVYISWKDVLIDNPEWISYQSRKFRREYAQKINKQVKNPVGVGDQDPGDIMDGVERAISKLFDEPELKEEVPDQFLRVGTFDFHVPNPKDVGYDMNVSDINDSEMKFFKMKVHRHQLLEMEKKGIFKNVSSMDSSSRQDQTRIEERYIKNIASTKAEDERDELIFYFGDLVINDKVVKKRYACVIGNGSALLREGSYPFWEPMGKHTPISSLYAKEIPHKAGGAGAADAGVTLQKHYDAMWHMQYDQAMRTMAGLTMIEHNALVDKSILERGVSPGELVEVRGNPKEKVMYQSLSSNIENQVKPAAEAVRQGIEDAGGLSALTSGGAQLRSRTTKAEIEQRGAADSVAIDDMSGNIADFLAEIIHTLVARFLQFGLDDIKNNATLQAIFEEGELQALLALTDEDKIRIINGSFQVRIKGFLGAAQRSDAISKLNELIFMANSNPQSPIAAMLPMQSILESWFEMQDMGDLGLKLDMNNEAARVYAENQILRNNQYLEPSPQDNHEVHIQSHMADPSAQTPAGQAHMQQHQAMFQQQQMMQQQQAMMQQQQQQQNPLVGQLQQLQQLPQ